MSLGIEIHRNGEWVESPNQVGFISRHRPGCTGEAYEIRYNPDDLQWIVYYSSPPSAEPEVRGRLSIGDQFEITFSANGGTRQEVMRLTHISPLDKRINLD